VTLGYVCRVTPPRPGTHCLFNGRRLILQGAPERRHIKQALEGSLLFEPSSLTPSELRVDEYELWAGGLGQQTGAWKVATSQNACEFAAAALVPTPANT